MFYKSPFIKEKNLVTDCKPSIGLISKIAERVVERYINRGAVPYREKHDVIMSVIEKFLHKREKIDSAFEGKSQLTTYYTAILNRMCCEVIRKEQKHWYNMVEEDTPDNKNSAVTTSYETEKGMLFKEELIRLSHVMLFFNGSSAKVNLFLKFFYDIPLSEEDIKRYCGEKAEITKPMLSQQKSKAETFETMAAVINLIENKDISGDAARMWFNKQIDIILCRLNGNGFSNHDKESLGILLDIKVKNNSEIMPNQTLSIN